MLLGAAAPASAAGNCATDSSFSHHTTRGGRDKQHNKMPSSSSSSLGGAGAGAHDQKSHWKGERKDQQQGRRQQARHRENYRSGKADAEQRNRFQGGGGSVEGFVGQNRRSISREGAAKKGKEGRRRSSRSSSSERGYNSIEETEGQLSSSLSSFTFRSSSHPKVSLSSAPQKYNEFAFTTPKKAAINPSASSSFASPSPSHSLSFESFQSPSASQRFSGASEESNSNGLRIKTKTTPHLRHEIPPSPLKGVAKAKRPQGQRLVASRSKTPKLKRKTQNQLRGGSLNASASAFSTSNSSSNAGEGSDSDSSGGSSDEAYPHEHTRTKRDVSNAFSDKLSLFSPQRRIPRRVSREAVIDTIFATLFEEKKANKEPVFKAWDESDTDNDEEFLKQGLEIALSKELSDEALYGLSITLKATPRHSDLLKRFVDKRLIYKLANELRFEDHRTSSARVPLLRGIYKKCPHLRLDIARAVSLSCMERFESQQLKLATVRTHEIDTGDESKPEDRDHGHSLSEILHFLIEERFTEPGVKVLNFESCGKGQNPAVTEQSQAIQEFCRALVALCRAHTKDGNGTDEDELLNCAGQFVMYYPPAGYQLLQTLLKKFTPTTSVEQELFFVRLCGRILFVSPRVGTLNATERVHSATLKRICSSLKSPHLQVAREVLALVGSQYMTSNHIVPFPPVFQLVRKYLNENSAHHWNQMIRESSEELFDQLLDYA